MTKVTDGSEMRDLRLLKRNAYKAVDDALKKMQKRRIDFGKGNGRVERRGGTLNRQFCSGC